MGWNNETLHACLKHLKYQWGMQTCIFCILKGCTGVHFVRKCKVRRKESFDQLANMTVNKTEALYKLL